MQASDVRKLPVGGEDIARGLVFSGFWGSIFYLLACVSLVAGARRDTVKVHAPTLGLGYGVHVLAFIVGGSLVTTLASLVRGRGPTEQAEAAIGGGQLERGWPLQALGGAAGSLAPFALAVASQHLATQRTGHKAIAGQIRWPVAGGTMVAATGLTSLAVARIAAWVASDAKKG